VLAVKERSRLPQAVVTPLALCLRPLTDLIDFAWGDPEIHAHPWEACPWMQWARGVRAKASKRAGSV
jgi:hypothetical protein